MRGHDLRNFSRDLLAHFRDLLVAKVTGGSTELLETSGADPRQLARTGSRHCFRSRPCKVFHSRQKREQFKRLLLAALPVGTWARGS